MTKILPILFAFLVTLWPTAAPPAPSEPPELVADPEITILMYHHLTTAEEQITEPTLVVTPQRLAEQLTWFLANGYTPLPLSAVEAHLYRDEPLPAKTLVVTFDDGYRSNYELAYPVLKELRVPATIFIIGIEMDRERPYWAEPFMTWHQASEMVNSGLISIHSHTYDLHHYPTGVNQPAAVVFSSAEVLADFQRSRQQIDHRLGYTTNYLSFPYGWYTDREIALAQEAGFTLALSVEEGINTKATNPYRLKRFTMSQDDTPERLQARFGD